MQAETAGWNETALTHESWRHIIRDNAIGAHVHVHRNDSREREVCQPRQWRVLQV